jgi:hypothetical protein
VTAYEPAHRRDMRERLSRLCGRPLVSEQAEQARLLAQALGVELVWTRIWLNPGDEEKAKRAKERPKSAVNHR